MAKYGLSDAEFEIMDYIWRQEGEVLFKEVMAYLGENGHEWKKQTVQTFMTRLIGKNALKAEKRGNKAYYTPAMSEIKFASKWIREFLTEEFGGKLSNFVCAFAAGDKLSKEEIEELKEYLEE